tara:strand:- start:784 stop:960 length:177 start_codon:yes stop_codon:yes gene_type:complete
MKNLLNFMFLMVFPNFVFAHNLGHIHLHGAEFILYMMMVLLIFMKTRKVLNVRRIKND